MGILKAVLRCHQGFEFNDTHTQRLQENLLHVEIKYKNAPLKAPRVDPLLFPTQIYQGRVSLEGEHAVYTHVSTHTHRIVL